MVLRLIALVAVVTAESLQAQNPAKAPPPGNIGRADSLGRSKTVAPLKHGWLGFRTLLNPDDSRFIAEVAEGSPAERAGLRPGDQIIASDLDEAPMRPPPFGAQRLPDSSDTRRLVPTPAPAYGPVIGRSYELSLRRGNETFSVSLVAVAPPKGQVFDLVPTRIGTPTTPDSVEARATAYRTELARTTLQPTKVPLRTGVPLGAQGFEVTRVDSGGYAVTRIDSAQALTIDGRVFYPTRRGTLQPTPRLDLRSNAIAGAELEQLNPALGAYFGGVTEGVFILRVGANSPAAAAGLQPGDVVQSVNSKAVLTIDALRDAVAASSGTITLRVLRKGKPVTVPLRKE
jgi:membrane-associated protease RseP (regulator of RpoE activity)